MTTEKRLIDSDALISVIDGLKSELPGWEDYNAGIDSAVYKVENAPTADAVEVVRCKDCMWSRPKDNREPTDTPRELICQCFKHHHIPAPWGARMAVNTDDFCSYGERKSDG